MKHKMRGIFMFFLLLIASFAIAIFLIEAACFVKSCLFYPRLTITDRVLGWKYRPSTKNATRKTDKNAIYTLNINSDGFRDDEFVKGKDCFKIMVLGDSMTFGMEADQKDIFCNVLERRLKDAYPGRSIDVMNFGITGFGTGQELICLREYGKMYEPNVVVLMMLDDNDFDDNIAIVSAGRYMPYFVIKSDGLVLYNEPTVLQRVLSFLRDKSFIAFFLVNKTRLFSELARKERNVGEEGKIVLAQRILDEMHKYTQSRGTPFFVFYVTVEKPKNHKCERIKEYCAKNNIPFLIVPEREDERFYRLGHWNSKGHFACADIIYNQLSKYKALDALTREK